MYQAPTTRSSKKGMFKGASFRYLARRSSRLRHHRPVPPCVPPAVHFLSRQRPRRAPPPVTARATIPPARASFLSCRCSHCARRPFLFVRHVTIPNPHRTTSPSPRPSTSSACPAGYLALCSHLCARRPRPCPCLAPRDLTVSPWPSDVVPPISARRPRPQHLRLLSLPLSRVVSCGMSSLSILGSPDAADQ